MTNKIPDANYFIVLQETGKKIPRHLVLRPRGNQTPVNQKALAELRDKLLPDFMAWAGLNDLTQQGFRLAAEIKQLAQPVVHLMSGKNVAAQNPQDWLTPSVPWNPAGPAVFFEKCAAAAQARSATMAFGNQMLYAGEHRDVFGVQDGDPKAETHFLVLATEVFSSIMDQGFTAEHLNRFFETAWQLCAQLKILDQPIRFVVNTGTGFQVGPRVHMHVTSAKTGLPSLFPCNYGFEVKEDGTIFAPQASAAHEQVINLIRQRRQIAGFSPEAKQQKQAIDQVLLAQLALMCLV